MQTAARLLRNSSRRHSRNAGVILDFVAGKFGFSQEMLTAGWEVFSQTFVQTPMIGYGDLAILRELPFELYLVTSGFRRLQESKIRALKIGHVFRGIEIDAIESLVSLSRRRASCLSTLNGTFGSSL